jgi:hypothetical protein
MITRARAAKMSMLSVPEGLTGLAHPAWLLANWSVATPWQRSRFAHLRRGI